MTQKLSDILNLTDCEIENAKIEFNMHPADADEEFIEKWLKHTKIEKESGNCSDCSYWNDRGGRKNYKIGEIVFSFVRLDKDEWLFISAGEVIDEGVNDRARVNVLDKYFHLFGKLIIKNKTGYIFRRYSYYLSTHLNDITVKEILPELYSGKTL